MKQTKKKNHFNFKDVIFDYIGDMLYVYYLTNNNDYNKEIDLLVKDMGYIRDRLVKSRPLREIKIGTEYQWLGIYFTKEGQDMIQAEIDRYNFIRSAPIIGNLKN